MNMTLRSKLRDQNDYFLNQQMGREGNEIAIKWQSSPLVSRLADAAELRSQRRQTQRPTEAIDSRKKS